MLLSVLNWSIGPCPIQFLRLDSFKGGFSIYFLKIFVVPHPFSFWCSPSKHYILIMEHLPLPHQIFPVSCLFVCFHTTLCLFPPFSVQFRSVDQSSPTLYNPMNCKAHQASLSIANLHSSFKFMFIESVIPPSLSTSIISFSSWPQSLLASGSFSMSQHFMWECKVLEFQL